MLSFVNEVTAVQNPKVLKESKTLSGWKLKFEACLQTSDRRNNNNRIYPHKDLSEAVGRINPRVIKRAFVGELDHPTADDMKRQVIVLYKECAHVITKFWWSGNELMGHLESLTTPNGKILTELIKDDVPVGFSVRALGNMKKENNIEVIGSPIYIITYDAVSDPSHQEATVRSINESRICIGDICFNTCSAESVMDYYVDGALKNALILPPGIPLP